MHVVVLGYEGHLLASPERLHAAALRLGMKLTIASPDDISVTVNGTDIQVTLHGQALDCDAVLPRGTSVVGPFLDTALTAGVEAGINVINSPQAIRVCEDKLRTAVVLAWAGVPQLPTAGVLPGGSCPPWPGQVYTKPAWASRGRGIVRHDTHDAADAALAAMRNLTLTGSLVEHLVAQPAASGSGVDYRVLVAQDRVVAIIERTALGGSPVTSELSSSRRPLVVSSEPALCAVALAATEAVGARFVGVDLVEHEGVPVVIEVNASPGLLYAGKVTGLDLEELLLSLAT